MRKKALLSSLVESFVIYYKNIIFLLKEIFTFFVGKMWCNQDVETCVSKSISHLKYQIILLLQHGKVLKYVMEFFKIFIIVIIKKNWIFVLKDTKYTLMYYTKCTHVF